MSTQIQIRRDTTANWEGVNPVLADGEIGFDTTASKFKVGNGSDEWQEIEYSVGADGSGLVDGDAYIRLEDGSWVASPSMTFEGDITVNGNITVDGGQVIDPDGNAIGGGGGGGAWELVEKLSGSDLSAFEFDLNPDEFHAYRFFVDIKPDNSGAEFWMQLGSEGEWISSSEYTTEFFSGGRGNAASGGTTQTGYWKPAFSNSQVYGNASHWEVRLTGLGKMPPPATLYNRPAISFLGGGGIGKNDAMFWIGSGSLNYQTAPIDRARLLPKSPITWAGSVTMEGLRN